MQIFSIIIGNNIFVDPCLYVKIVRIVNFIFADDVRPHRCKTICIFIATRIKEMFFNWHICEVGFRHWITNEIYVLHSHSSRSHIIYYSVAKDMVHGVLNGNISTALTDYYTEFRFGMRESVLCVQFQNRAATGERRIDFRKVNREIRSMN